MRGTRKERFVRSIVKQPVSARRESATLRARELRRNSCRGRLDPPLSRGMREETLEALEGESGELDERIAIRRRHSGTHGIFTAVFVPLRDFFAARRAEEKEEEKEVERGRARRRGARELTGFGGFTRARFI